MRTEIVAFFVGILFAIGLALGGMTDPNKVLAFLDITGDWDPSLAFVMGGAIAVYAPLRALIIARAAKTGRSAEPSLPTIIDRRLVIGAILFGLGWGLIGYCPGPMIVAVTSLAPVAVTAALAMFAGMELFAWWNRR